MRTCGPFASPLTQADNPSLVAGELRLLFAFVVRIVFNEENVESGEDEGKTAGAEEGYEVLESRKERWRQRGVQLDNRGRE